MKEFDNWIAPVPSPELDRRVLTSWRAATRAPWWRRRIAVPVPALAVPAVAAACLFAWALLPRSAAPPAVRIVAPVLHVTTCPPAPQPVSKRRVRKAVPKPIRPAPALSATELARWSPVAEPKWEIVR